MKDKGRQKLGREKKVLFRVYRKKNLLWPYFSFFLFFCNVSSINFSLLSFGGDGDGGRKFRSVQILSPRSKFTQPTTHSS